MDASSSQRTVRHELYEGTSGPIYAMHFNGTCHAIFATANAALAWQRGNDRPQYFHLEDARGQRVTMADQPRYPGHAYAIIDKLKERQT